MKLTIMTVMLALAVFGCAQRHVQEATPREMETETWGIASLSVASAREAPDHKAEMGTQVLMGHGVRVWQEYASDKRAGVWFAVETQDGYRAWLDKRSFIRCSKQELNDWNESELLIVTAMEDCILENPRADAQTVSDMVIGNLVKRTGSQANWHAVELPDGRRGATWLAIQLSPTGHGERREGRPQRRLNRQLGGSWAGPTFGAAIRPRGWTAPGSQS